MDISHYNALLRVYLENEHPFSPTDFLSDLEAKGIEPNRVTYQRLIARYCQLGDIEGATRILEFMREKQLPVNENVFNALIMGHSHTDDMESAKGILGVMTQAGLEPSADTYTTLLCGYARRGDLDAMKATLEECEGKEIYLLDKDYLDVIFSLATNGHNEHVPFVLSKIRKSVGYNQDAVNLILRLVNYGQEETALEVLKTIPIVARPDGVVLPSGNFLIRQMVKANRPIGKIISVCKHLEDTDLNPKALLYATEISLQIPQPELAFSLLQELQKGGQTIRQHFFWPLIVAKGKEKDQKSIYKILEKMHGFNLVPSSETLREYVLPNIAGKTDDIINKLRDVGVSIGTAASSLLYNYLVANNFKEAATLSQRVNSYYSPVLLKKPLTSIFLKTKDIESYITIVRRICENLDRRDNEEKENKNDVVGAYVLEFTYAAANNVQVVADVLNALVQQGLSMSNGFAEKIQDRLGEKLTSEISTLLGKMTSGELHPVPIERSEPHYVPSSAMNIPQLERLISNLDAKGENTVGLKRQLLTLYTRAQEVKKTEALLQTLEKQNFTYTIGVYAQLIDLYSHAENLEKVREYIKRIDEMESGTQLDPVKVINVANLMIKKDKFDDAVAFLNSQGRNRKEDEKSFSYNSFCWRLLTSLAEKGEEEKLDKLFDTLVKNHHIEVTNVLLGPLIKVQLVKKDLKKAMEKFEWCVTHYKATPWKNELACQLIQNEDAANLQKLTDLSTVIHGEVNSLYDLVFSFAECGRIRQARRILETPGLQNRTQRLNNACERYREEGAAQTLEGLMEATKDLTHIDRGDIYYQLLLTYISKKDSDKAIGLWTQMQEEDVHASEEFLMKLGSFLKSQGREVPFVVPDLDLPKNDLVLFRQFVKTGDVDKALQLKNSIQTSMNVNDYSALLEILVKAERLNEAAKLCFEMLRKNLYPIPRIFRFLLNKIANNGDVKTIESIGNKLSSDMKKLLSFDNRFCHANIVAGKSDEYLDTLIKEIENAKDEHVEILAEKFPRGGAVGILEKCPELSAKYESLAEKYAKRGVIAPMNVLWAHHFINEDETAAQRVWDTHLKNTPRIMFQRVVQLARETKNESLIRRLIHHLKSTKVTDGALGNAYSCLFDVLVSLEKTDETVEEFEKISKDLNIEFINRTALVRVKEIYDRIGKEFKYSIPKKLDREKYSSPSSDDDRKN